MGNRSSTSVDHLDERVVEYTVGLAESIATNARAGEYVVHETNGWCNSDYRLSTPTTVAWFDAFEVHALGESSVAFVGPEGRTKVAYDLDTLPDDFLEQMADTVAMRGDLNNE